MAGILVDFSFAGLVYGGHHLLAWDAPFPSQLERTLWRGSGIFLASSGIGLIAVSPALAWLPRSDTLNVRYGPPP